jgi:NAD(P)-dependent dehydrogenase (short-subunit alcohol dehydrogenase family)
MTSSLDGRTALVTGAGRGIGRAIALGLAREGAGVALVARSDTELAETGERIRDIGGTAHPIPADLADPAGFGKVVARASDLGPVDILVNNAARVTPLGPSVGVDPDAWAAAIDLDLTVPVRLTFALLPGMLERGERSARSLLARLAANASGQVWDVSDAIGI